MLWCKKTFQQVFDESELRLFPTQRQLFEYLDGDGSGRKARDEWLPFSIELYSELEVTQILSHHGNRGPRKDPSRTLFRRVEKSLEEGESTPVSPAVAGHTTTPKSNSSMGSSNVRESYALLYGETPLSTQSRMFLAATVPGLTRLLSHIEPKQLHLYEIIREGAPCHLYFDVEREVDLVSLQEETTIDSGSSDGDSDIECVPRASEPVRGKRRCEMPDAASAGITSRAPPLCHREEDQAALDTSRYIVTATYQTRHGPGKYRSTVGEYRKLLSQATHLPTGMCPLDCSVTANNECTSGVLLRELDTFVREHYPFLAYRGGKRSTSGETVPSQHSRGDGKTPFLPDWAKAVIILESVPLLPGVHSRKFSQHYVIQLKRHVFDCNASAGEFVKQFVNHLDGKCAVGCERTIHRSLFYHGEHVLQNVLSTLTVEHPSPALPFATRRCVIDTAVYSRNRMMRCLGSCKLHKTNTLRVAHWLPSFPGEAPGAGPAARPTTSDLLNSLITARAEFLDAGDMGLLRVEGSCAATHNPLDVGVGIDSALWHEWQTGITAPTAVGEIALASASASIEMVYRQLSGCPTCRLGPPRQRGARFVLFQVNGTRFCQNVMREHKSNSVYVVVDLEKSSWVQKCFDPDCAQYRSPPVPLTSSL